jgi:predicted RNA methylase
MTPRRDIERLESIRIRLQEELDGSRTAAERNRLGQFATPRMLARDMLRYARLLWRARPDHVRFLDPAVGTGSFFSALVEAFPGAALESAVGIEVDCQYAETARSLWAGLGLQVVTGDFTALPVPSTESLANLVVANPPYVRHHHLSPARKRELKALSAEVLGAQMNGLAGLYCYFILLAHRWLAQGGIGVWLIPSEFMDVNYGSAVKRYLTDKVTLIRVHRFDPRDVQFEDALVSSSIVVFRKAPPRENHKALFSSGGSLLSPGRRVRISLTRLRCERRWSNLDTDSGGGGSADAVANLASLFTIRRGIATGANSFFILKRDQAERLGIDRCFLKPVLPSPRHMHDTIIDSDEDGYPLIEKQLALIDSGLPEHEIKMVCPPLYEYLQSGKQAGIRDSYLIAKRTPWYEQEKRPPAPFLCTYMGRSTGGRNPFRFIWNRSKATATNVYLLLYPKGDLAAALSRDPTLAKAVFEALQGITAEEFLGQCRVYGGGLHKAEPAELGRVPATRLVNTLGLDPPRQPRQPALF